LEGQNGVAAFIGNNPRTASESKQERYCFVKRAKVWYGAKTLVAP
jgi:hypothetical protein